MTTPQPTGRVQGKVALVTGAGSGIGRATALVLAAHGATVLCADIDLAAAEQTGVTASGHAQQLDVTTEPQWQEVTAHILQMHKRLDIVVNCAGISFTCPVADMDINDWRRIMSVNLDGVVLGTKHAIRTMRQAGNGGSIVNVASVSGIKAHATASAYCASKAAVLMFSKSAALECLHAGDNIRVNCVSPSGVKTPMWKTMPFFQDLMAKEGGEEEAFAAMARMSPHGRWALPEEVALAILYLASDESSFVNGTNLVFDNGNST